MRGVLEAPGTPPATSPPGLTTPEAACREPSRSPAQPASRMRVVTAPHRHPVALRPDGSPCRRERRSTKAVDRRRKLEGRAHHAAAPPNARTDETMGRLGPTPTGHWPVIHAAAGSLGGRSRRGLNRRWRSIGAAGSMGSDPAAGTIADRCCEARPRIGPDESRTWGTSPPHGGRASAAALAAAGELGRVSAWSCCQESLVCRMGRSEPWHPLAKAGRCRPLAGKTEPPARETGRGRRPSLPTTTRSLHSPGPTSYSLERINSDPKTALPRLSMAVARPGAATLFLVGETPIW